MRIRRPRNLTSIQFLVITGVGVLAGVYIWQPLILKYRKESYQNSVAAEIIKDGHSKDTEAKSNE